MRISPSPKLTIRAGENPQDNRNDLSSSKERHAKLIFVNRNGKRYDQRDPPKTRVPHSVISWPGFNSHSLVRPVPFFSATCSIVFLTSSREA